ncbi:MAG TPA: hypothetical protein PKA00_18295 [Saprospiraceae bacterium]|nr:hypothetical protein [Saprospiraceae bacterium]HMQ84869.1 hypothetical protein [Saprospiraceae bacterium]
MLNKKWVLLTFILGLSCNIYSQKRADGSPVAFTASEKVKAVVQLQVQQFKAYKTEKALLEDTERGVNNRFAAPISANMDMSNTGEWETLPDGSRLWRLRLYVPEVQGIGILYDDFFLPVGSSLFVYSEDGKQVLGAYTFQNNRPSRQFFTGFIAGQRAIIEYHEPAEVLGQGSLHISRIDGAYRPLPQVANSFGFGTAMACHKNVNCPEGDDWENQKNGSCRIIMVLEEGTGYCSGSLVNNTERDGKPYILGAFHCDDGYTPIHDLWRFDFHYESPDCDNPSEEPDFNSLLGCTLRAARLESDFQLYEITESIPASWDLYFNGWNKGNGLPLSGAILHHPSGDIKKIASYEGGTAIQATSIDWNNNVTTPANHHFRVNYDDGSFEPGSSGSGLFDHNDLIVGQLHGGFGDCESDNTVYFGRFRLSWDAGSDPATRLKDWLDPNGIAGDTLHGMSQPSAGNGSISGWIHNEAGMPIANVQLTLSDGNFSASTQSDINGNYQFEEVPLGMVYELSLSKDDDAQNGLSNLDLIRISRQVLGIEALTSPIKMISADVNDSSGLSTLDQISIQKVVLGIDTAFSNRPDWIFFEEEVVFPNPSNPFAVGYLETPLLINLDTDLIGLDFIGIKSGDIDDSAEPGN